jgi:putative nucleotide binding protein
MSFRGRHRRIWIPDEYAYILDFMPLGNPYDKHTFHKTNPVAQGIGSKYFTLVEIVPPRGTMLNIGERVPISLTPRGIELKVFDRLAYEDLTTIARTNLEKVVKDIVIDKEKIFVEFFNVAEAINIRLHSLELLPGIGKKTLILILDERKKKPFESFEDLKKRIRIPDPIKVLTERIVAELQRAEKYYLFVEPYPPSPNYIFLNYLYHLYEKLGYYEPW